MIRRLLVSALIAVLAAAAPAAVAYADAPAFLVCELPYKDKDGKPGEGMRMLIPTAKSGMQGAVRECRAMGGHPAGVSNGKKV